MSAKIREEERNKKRETTKMMPTFVKKVFGILCCFRLKYPSSVITFTEYREMKCEPKITINRIFCKSDTTRVEEVESVNAAVIQMCGYTTNMNLSSLCATPDMNKSQTKKDNAITKKRNLGIEVIWCVRTTFCGFRARKVCHSSQKASNKNFEILRKTKLKCSIKNSFFKNKRIQVENRELRKR